MERTHDASLGYLPEERPPLGKLILYALQQVIVMFPATVTVAIITGFQVSTTIFASGLATLFFIVITGKKIPLYYGSSFAYLTAISSMVAAEGTAEQLAQFEATKILPPELISQAQFGIVLSGFVSIAAGLIVRFCGHRAVEKILPASITGPVAMIIGLTLAGNALTDAAPAAGVTGAAANWTWVHRPGHPPFHHTLLPLPQRLPRPDTAFARRGGGLCGGGAAAPCRRRRVQPLPRDARRGAGRLQLEAGRRLHLCLPAFTFPKASWAAGSGHHAHCHRHHP